LIHTRLKVDFNFQESQLNGEAWLTLTPHFYPTNKLVLDAKAFLIHEVRINGATATYNYSDDELTIELDKTYQRDEQYEIFVKYTAQPEKVRQKGSAAISDAKGLYFIDPKEEDDEKPTQIWTQGETEASSCWFPTIDSPNQKTTQEISMRVPDKYVTLSNGILKSQTDHPDGTRTDYWHMDQKHAPYLFFMGVGEFSVVKDTWNDLEVNYYVEKEYEAVAKDIFGHTPEMLTFFSKITGVEYPWDKYSQIVVRDYVSGAMENTTAVVHGEDAQQSKGQLIDDNKWEGVIAHEVFHHWFGDLVTTESWSNLTVNESFATYSVYLWFEYKYGKDKADAHLYSDIQTYLQSQKSNEDLVRFYYEDKEHMFDPVSYHKGSAILHMLRDIIGDEAFFEGLNYYLTRYQYGTAEAHELRLAFEKVTGKDLNWFFNQWYFGNSHINMTVTYDYNVINKTVTVNIKQLGKTFEFPLTIDIYEGTKKSRHDLWIKDSEESFTFVYNKIPNLINIDPEHILLKEMNNKKSLDNYLFQFKYATHYLDRKLALEEIVKHQQESKEAYFTIIDAFDDPYYEIRAFALENIDLFQKYNKKDAIMKIERMAQFDDKSIVRAAALQVLGKLLEPIYKPLFEKGLNAESHAIMGSSIISMYQLDKGAALNKIESLDAKTKGHLADAITNIYISEQDKTQLPTDDFVELGKQYKKYNFDKMAINMINQLIGFQNQANNDNKEDILIVLKTGLANLME
jgi:aminopeptidase N